MPPKWCNYRTFAAAEIACVVALFFMNAIGTALTVLAVGQLGRAVVLFVRDRKSDAVGRS